jgi:hypothetical protein
MEIAPLNKTTFPSIRLNYNLDSTVSFTSDNFENEQNLDILLNNVLYKSRDIASNKYSNFYLTDRKPLASNIEFKELATPRIEKFTTWLASDADRLLNTKTDFWTVGSDNESAGLTIDVAASGIFTQIDNTYIFDVEFLNDKICRVSHNYYDYTRYLTINALFASGNTFMCTDNGQDPYDPNSTQSFCYLYDRKNDFLVLYKLVNDIAFVVQTFEATKDLTLVIPPTSDDFGFTSDQIYRCRTRFETETKPVVNSIWAQYEKSFKDNNLIIDDRPAPYNIYCPSYASVDNNLLLNTEYYNLSDETLPVNILTLKNTNTPEGYQSKNNPFSVKEPEIQQRQYRKIFTGASQLGGDDNIKIGYEAFTSQRIFEPDKLTYFHAPQDLFPYLKLNISDTGLIEAGALAGNHPLKADKLFKKRGNYKYSSPFGDSNYEQSGQFLCTWLSGGDGIAKRPVWVDRYYFPETSNFLTALTAAVNPFVNYSSEIQGVKNEMPLLKQPVVDIPSRFTFEPGALYAYHHIGKSTNNQLIKNLEKYLFQKNLTVYNDITYNTLSGEEIPKEEIEYLFNGFRFGKTQRVSSPENFNQFSLSFYLYANDWKSKFANQIAGNYVNDGFGVFNINYTTPYITLISPSAINIFNTDLEYVDKKNFDASVQNIIRFDQTEDYFAVKTNDEMIRVNIDNVSLNKVVAAKIGKAKSVYPFNDNLALVLTGVGSEDFFTINTDTGGISAYNKTPYLFDAANNIDFNNTGFTNIMYHNKQIYVIQGYSPQIYNNTIFVSWKNFIWNYNTISKERFSAYKFDDGLIDFNIDFDGIIWALHGKNKISKIETNPEKNIQWTKTYNLSGSFVNIDLLSYFKGNEYRKDMVAYYRLSGSPSGLGVLKLDYDGEIMKSTILNSNLSSHGIADTTGGDYARYYVKQQYPENSLSTKIKLRNVYDFNDYKKVELKFDLSAFDVGYHHVCVRADTYKGLFSLYIDGENVKNALFPVNNYIFNNLLKEPFYVGASPAFNNKLLATRYKQKDAFLANNMKVKDIFLYNKPLDDYQIRLHDLQGREFYNIVFDIPSGRRNILDEIEFVFKNKVPGFKTGIFDLEVKNTGITDIALKLNLEKQIKQLLADVIPSYTKLRNIIWR